MDTQAQGADLLRQLTSVVLNATHFSLHTRAILLGLAATLSSEEMRHFLDQFYQPQFLAECVALKSINDISENDAEYVQKVIFDAIPDNYIASIDTTELLNWLTTEGKDKSWRDLPEFKLTSNNPNSTNRYRQ